MGETILSARHISKVGVETGPWEKNNGDNNTKSCLDSCSIAKMDESMNDFVQGFLSVVRAAKVS